MATVEQIEAIFKKLDINLVPLFEQMTEQEFDEFEALSIAYINSLQDLPSNEIDAKLGT